MDIAITLPRSLWDKIVSGEKTIELRKNTPQEFNEKTDRVYVCLKATERVVGFFTVLSFHPIAANFVTSCKDIVKKIAVPEQWIDDYLKNSSWAVLWYIEEVVVFKGIGNHRSFYSIDKNPQSWVYLQ